MKQVFLSNKNGIVVESVAPPPVSPGTVLIETAYSVISSGTEATSLTAAGGVARKLVRNPALARTAWNLVSSSGVHVARELISDKMNERVALGYSASGTVVASGAGVGDLKPGMRVACGGAGHAVHAEMVAVPRNLVVPVPDNVSLREAALTTIGAVAVQGLRRADPKFGETVVVIGLGIVGQLTLQLLRAAGCQSVALDRDRVRLSLTRDRADLVVAADAPDVEGQIRSLTDGVGADAVIICAASASAAKLAIAVCRGRGRIVLVGLAPFNADAVDLIGKELEVTGSRSYGPGRYDAEYELKGRDYPIEYVRWTERRNMDSFLRLAASGRLALDSIITHEFELDDARSAYALLKSDSTDHLGIVLKYQPQALGRSPAPVRVAATSKVASGRLKAVLVGGGGFMKTVVVPNLTAAADVEVIAAVSGTGALADQIARRSRAAMSSCDLASVLADADADFAIIANRHDAHAASARTALSAGVHVMIEKPMALTAADCFDLVRLARERSLHIAVGFNRRLAPLAQLLRDRVAQRSAPVQILYRVNAGRLPAGHWLDDAERGGGRLLGEGCHFLDFCSWLLAEDPLAITAVSPDTRPVPQNFSIVLEYPRGSATILYSTTGNAGLPKERIEVSAGGASYVLDNFERLESFGESIRSRNGKGDKGYKAEFAAFVDKLRGKDVPDLATGEDGARATILGLLALRSMRTGTRLSQPWRLVESADIDRELLSIDD